VQLNSEPFLSLISSFAQEPNEDDSKKKLSSTALEINTTLQLALVDSVLFILSFFCILKPSLALRVLILGLPIIGYKIKILNCCR
jgi:hypothetical protein